MHHHQHHHHVAHALLKRAATGGAEPTDSPMHSSGIPMSARQGNIDAAERLNLALALFLAVCILGFAPRTAHWIGSGSANLGWLFSARRRKAIRRSMLNVKAKQTVRKTRFASNLRWYYNRYLLPTVPYLGWTAGQTLVGVVLGGLTLFFLFINAGTWNVNYGRPAWISMGLFPATFILATKNNLITVLIGKGMEKLNFLHRLLGRICALTALIHTFTIIILRMNRGQSLPWKEPLWAWGLLATMGAILVLVFSASFVRRTCYGLFLVSHIVGWLAFLVGLYFHVPKVALPYCAAALIPILLDIVLRVAKTRLKSALVTIMPNDMTRIELIGIRDGWRAGQYAFLRCFSFGAGAHPFTIASASGSRSALGRRDITFMTQAAGDWTRRLKQSAEAGMQQHAPDVAADPEKQQPIVISQMAVPLMIEGPYGGTGTVVLSEAQSVMLVAGGSGITFVIAVLEELIGLISEGKGCTKVVWVLWSIRNLEALAWFEDRFADLLMATKDSSLSFRLSIHCTNTQEKEVCPSPLLERYLNRQRCDHAAFVSHFVDSAIWENRNSPRGGLIVACCGPSRMGDDLRRGCSQIDRARHNLVGGITMHNEGFGW